MKSKLNISVSVQHSPIHPYRIETAPTKKPEMAPEDADEFLAGIASVVRIATKHGIPAQELEKYLRG